MGEGGDLVIRPRVNFQMIQFQLVALSWLHLAAPLG